MMEAYKLQKPNHALDEKELYKIVTTYGDLRDFLEAVTQPEYLYWDKVRYKPRPEGLSAEDFWGVVKFFRMRTSNRVGTVVRTESGELFSWQPLPGMDYFLHEVDMSLGGIIESPDLDDSAVRRRYITRGIMEEAIASSQLEGAITTRKAAKEMLINKRKPKNRSEQMIMNNYRAMRDVEERLRDQTIDKSVLLELHEILTRDTIDAADVGRFRRDHDNIVVVDRSSNLIYHRPPTEDFLDEEIDSFLSYANDQTLGKVSFVHPLIKAIILHFWVGYLHPFVDGNGRMARMIFYWYLLRRKYWGFTYLPISRVIRQSPAQYRNAYVYTEQDDNDLTYFIDYLMRKIRHAKQEFEKYLKRKERENRKIATLVRDHYGFNQRQIQLLRYLYKNEGATTTIRTYALIHSVSRLTARKDLQQLEQTGFLKSKKIGRERPYSASEKLEKTLLRKGRVD